MEKDYEYWEEKIMQYVSKMKESFDNLKAIKQKYDLPYADIESELSGMEHFKVISPVIGNFSTGKSSMINAVMGRELLSVDITPETAIPTEICYGPDRVFHYYGEQVTEYSIEDLPLTDLNVRNTDRVCIECSCPFFERIPSVKLVDLPGFDTSIELHNKAIDQYLPNSLAYLLVVSSDEPVLKDSITDLLRELKLFHVPVYVIITKSKRLSSSELEDCKRLLQKNVQDILEVDEVKCACVESIGDVDVEDVKKFLLEIQGETQRIFTRKYTESLRKSAKYVEFYLLDRIDKKDLSTSELEHEKEKLEKEMQEVMGRISREMEAFDTQLEECIQEVKKRIAEDMEGAVDILSVLIRNGNDIGDRINGIVRNAVAVSVKAEFEPKLQRYLANIAEAVQIDSPISEELKLNLDKKFEEGIVHSILVKVTPFVLAAIGAFISGPLLAIIGVAVGAFSDVAINLTSERKKNREAYKTAKELVEKVSVDAAEEAEAGMRRYVEDVNAQIRRKVEKQRELLVKSLEDVETELELEEAVKKQDIKNLETDLQSVRELMNVAD